MFLIDCSSESSKMCRSFSVMVSFMILMAEQKVMTATVAATARDGNEKQTLKCCTWSQCQAHHLKHCTRAAFVIMGDDREGQMVLE
ncbi:hypothetical protein ACB092_07G125000 [Castanea dentata]